MVLGHQVQELAAAQVPVQNPQVSSVGCDILFISYKCRNMILRNSLLSDMTGQTWSGYQLLQKEGVR